MTNRLRAAFRAARTVITSMADIVRPRFFISRYHAALCEIENTWIHEETMNPDTETCDGCEQQFDPELLTTCRYTESDGNIECLRFCPSCIAH